MTGVVALIASATQPEFGAAAGSIPSHVVDPLTEPGEDRDLGDRLETNQPMTSATTTTRTMRNHRSSRFVCSDTSGWNWRVPAWAR
ncbi:MAG: hypothetical protein M3487_06335 [Actinomycetota bacterium]|nr:hypothetical protein [Acidimicrobiia bacterium]MDQ3469365.1 hypothetical protein [Actinomycetota bacterium]